MKNKLVFVVTFVMLNNLFGQHSMYFEFENRYSFDDKTEIRHEVNVYGENIQPENKVGSYFYALTNDKWGEAYGGVLYKINGNLSINIGIGVETDSIPYRLNFGAFYKYKNTYISQWYEYGGSGFWYNIMAMYCINNQLQTGIIYKRYYGLGLNTYYKIQKIPIVINFAVLYDFV